MKVSDWVGLFTGSGVVCARQKWVVCARQKLVVCARYFCVILSLYLCNMILLVDASSFYIITRLITVWGCSSHHCVGFVLLGLHSRPSPPSPPPSFLLSLSFAQVLSHTAHNSSHLTTHAAHLTNFHLSQLNSHNSSHSTHLTQHNSLKSCFRAAFGGAAFVSSHWTSPKLSHTTHLTTHTTQLTQELLLVWDKISLSHFLLSCTNREGWVDWNFACSVVLVGPRSRTFRRPSATHFLWPRTPSSNGWGTFREFFFTALVSAQTAYEAQEESEEPMPATPDSYAWVYRVFDAGIHLHPLS